MFTHFGSAIVEDAEEERVFQALYGSAVTSRRCRRPRKQNGEWNIDGAPAEEKMQPIRRKKGLHSSRVVPFQNTLPPSVKPSKLSKATVGCQTNSMDMCHQLSIDSASTETFPLDGVRCRFTETRLLVSLAALNDALDADGRRKELYTLGTWKPKRTEIESLNSVIDHATGQSALLGMFPGSFPNKMTIDAWSDACNLVACSPEEPRLCLNAQYMKRDRDDIWRFEYPAIFAEQIKHLLEEKKNRRLAVPLVSRNQLMSAVLVVDPGCATWWTSSAGNTEYSLGVTEFVDELLSDVSGDWKQSAEPTPGDIPCNWLGPEDAAVVAMFFMESFVTDSKTKLRAGCLYALRFLYAKRLANTLGLLEFND